MALRLTEGADPARFARLAGRPLPAERVATLEAEGLLARRSNGCIGATAAGRPLLDAILRELLA